MKLDIRELRIAAGLDDAATLLKELMAMQVTVSAAGHEGFGARREGTHDDLVFALALACWGTKAEESAWGTRSLGIYRVID